MLSLVALSALFLCSYRYHRGAWDSPKKLNQEHRAAAMDLSMISLMISFSLAPCYALLLPQSWSWKFIGVTVAVALISAWEHARSCGVGRKTGTGLFILQGFLASAPLLMMQTTAFEKCALAIVGGSYLTGATIYAHEFPDPWPDTFGYHEIWHVLVVVAASMTLVANSSVLERTVQVI